MLVKRGPWLVPEVDQIGATVILDEATRLPEMLAYVPGDRRGIAVQAGGHVGIMVKPLAANFRTVYTFEPQPINFVCLCHNVPERNVVRIQGCLGARNHPPVGLDGWGANSAASFVNGAGIFPVFALDDLHLPALDLLMLDVEGFEWDALAGAKDSIDAYSPIIVVEMLGHGDKFGHPDAELHRLLSSWRYTVVHALERDRVYVRIA